MSPERNHKAIAENYLRDLQAESRQYEQLQRVLTKQLGMGCDRGELTLLNDGIIAEVQSLIDRDEAVPCPIASHFTASGHRGMFMGRPLAENMPAAIEWLSHELGRVGRRVTKLEDERAVSP